MKAPSELSKRSQKRWAIVLKEWRLNNQELFLLKEALQSLDEANEAKAVWKKEGMILIDDNKRSYLNPACAMEKKCKDHFLRLWSRIGFHKVKAKRRPGRPSESYIPEFEEGIDANSTE